MRAMLRAILYSALIVAVAIALGAFLGAVLAGADGSGLGAVVGAVLGMKIASRFLLDSMAVAAARSNDKATMKAVARPDLMQKDPQLIRSAWSISRFLRQEDEDRRMLEQHTAVKRLYSQQHHDLDIRDIPGAAHLARKRKRKR
ncbi:MAG: hypothetical protein OXT05_16125 [Chloroflexota bacterium]|nr:hypothetical protein [Chloroflexota bacterium]